MRKTDIILALGTVILVAVATYVVLIAPTLKWLPDVVNTCSDAYHTAGNCIAR